MVDLESTFLNSVSYHRHKTQYVIVHNGERLSINCKDTWGTVSGARSAINWNCKHAANMVRWSWQEEGGLEPGEEPDWAALRQQLKDWAAENLKIIDEHVWNEEK